MTNPPGGGALERPAGGRAAWGARSRFAVHLGLLCSAAAALGTLQFLHVRVAFHTDIGLVFVGLVVVHLAQRRRTIARMAIRIVRAGTLVERGKRGIRLAVSDLLLFFITANVLVSGVVDWSRGVPTQLPLPAPFYRWHLDLRDRPRPLPGGARLASEEAPPTVDDPLAGGAGTRVSATIIAPDHAHNR